METLSLTIEDIIMLQEATEFLMAQTVRSDVDEQRLERLNNILLSRIYTK